MVTKESDYLIHLAENQLKRLDNSLYKYGKNLEIEKNLLYSQVNNDHFPKSRGDSLPAFENVFDFEFDYSPFVNGRTHERQTIRTAPSRSFQRQQNISNNGSIARANLPRRPPTAPVKSSSSVSALNHSSISNHNTRDWRSGLELTKRYLGPNLTTTTVSSRTRNGTHSPSSDLANNKRQRVSTFWDNDGRRKTTPATIVSSSHRDEDKFSSKKNSSRKSNNYSRPEIRKYIRDKQRLMKLSNQSASGQGRRGVSANQMKPSSRSSVFGQPRPAPRSVTGFSHRVNHELDIALRKYPDGGLAYDQQPRMRTTVYDELQSRGILDNEEAESSGGDRITDAIMSTYSRLRCLPGGGGALSSTVDSGIETGEWLRTSTPENKAHHSATRMTTSRSKHKSPPSIGSRSNKRPPVAEKSLSSSRLDILRKQAGLPGATGNLKKSYYDKLTEIYRERLTAYDASSETEDLLCTTMTMGGLGFVGRKESLERISDSSSSSLLKDTSPLPFPAAVVTVASTTVPGSDDDNDKRAQYDLKPRKIDPDTGRDQSHFKSSATENFNQSTLAAELKKALLEAQQQLNLNREESVDQLSERISLAVQRFLETKENTERSLSNETPTRLLEPNNIQKELLKGQLTTAEKIGAGTQAIKKDPISTELEATSIEYEGRPSLDIKEKEPINESEETNSQMPGMEPSEISDSLNELVRRKMCKVELSQERVRIRRQKARDLIMMTRKYKRELQKMRTLEHKACEFTDLFLPHSTPFGDPGIFFDNKENSPRLSNNDDALLPDKHHLTSYNGHQAAATNSGLAASKIGCLASSSDKYGSSVQIPVAAPSLTTRTGSLNDDTDEEDLTMSVSIPEACSTISLSDRSELEARLVALNAELNKKQRLVAVLKQKQKQLLRSRVQYKELMLQKQIEMVDAHISELQLSIHDLEDGVGTATTAAGAATDAEDDDDSSKTVVLEQPLPAARDPDLMVVSPAADGDCAVVVMELSWRQPDRSSGGASPTSVVASSDFSEEEEEKELWQMPGCGDEDVEAVVRARTPGGEQQEPQLQDHAIKKQAQRLQKEAEDDEEELRLQDQDSENQAQWLQKEAEDDKEEPQLQDQESAKQQTKEDEQQNHENNTEPHKPDGKLEEPTDDVDFNSSFHKAKKPTTRKDPFTLETNEPLKEDSSTDSSLFMKQEILLLYMTHLTRTLPKNLQKKMLCQKKILFQEPNETMKQESSLPEVAEEHNYALVEELTSHLLQTLLLENSTSLPETRISAVAYNTTTDVRGGVYVDFFFNPSFTVASTSRSLAEECDWAQEDLQLMSPPIQQQQQQAAPRSPRPQPPPRPPHLALAEGNSAAERQQLSERAQWLVPLSSSQFARPLLEMAVRHFHEHRSDLVFAANQMPREFSQGLPVASEAELLSYRFQQQQPQQSLQKDADTSSQKRPCFIDKRVLFSLVHEVFSEVYNNPANDQCLSNQPWLHPSVRSQRHNFSLWRDDKPPETVEQMLDIVLTRVNQLFSDSGLDLHLHLSPLDANEEAVSMERQRVNRRRDQAESRLIRWCLRRQRDPVEKILISDMRREEAAWIHYDQAAFEVQVQIAADIFQILLDDTFDWLRQI